MNCQEFRDAMPELTEPAALPYGARSASEQTHHEDLERHLEQCAACATRLRNLRALQAGMRALAGQMSHVTAPARLESQLRKAFHAHSGVPRRGWSGAQIARGAQISRWVNLPRWAPILTGATASLAALALAIFLVQVRMPERAVAYVSQGAVATVLQTAAMAPPVEMPAEIETGDSPLLADSGFIALPNAGQAGPIDNLNLVRVEVSRSAMIAMGFDVKPVELEPEESGESVRADVVLDADGLARAVRFLD